MGHIAVLAQPISGFTSSCPVWSRTTPSRLHRCMVFWLCVFSAMSTCRSCRMGPCLIVDEEVDTSSRKLTADVWKNWSLPPPPSFLPFCKDSNRCFSCFTGCSKVAMYFCCIGFTRLAVFYIHKVDDIELTSFWQFPAFWFIL